jgi:SAM-dependent methyltransferase
MVAIEPEPRAADLAHRAFDELTVMAGCADELPVQAATFGGTSLLGVASLVADLAGVLDEQARVVRPGGRLAIADLVSASSTAVTVEASGNHFRPLDELVAGVTAAGFAVDAVWTAPAAIATRWTAVAALVDAEIARQHSGSTVYAAWANDATRVRRLIDEASVSLATITATRLS